MKKRMNRDGVCSIDGCALEILAQRMCSMHYGRSLAGRSMLKPRAGTLTPDQRFQSFVKKTDGCWEWIGAKDRQGYGIYSWRTTRGHFTHRATRYAWRMQHGGIRNGLFICHHCDNPCCVRIDHLFIGTAKENSADMIRKGRSQWQRVLLAKVNEMLKEHA